MQICLIFKVSITKKRMILVIEKLVENFLLFKRAINAINKIAPKYMVLVIINSTINSFFPFISLHLSTRIINCIAQQFVWENIIENIISLIVVSIVFEITNKFLNKEIKVAQVVFDVEEEYYLNQKGFNLDLQQIEDAEVRILRQKISDNRMWGGLKKLTQDFTYVYTNLCQVVLALFILLGYLLSFSQTMSKINTKFSYSLSIVFITAFILALVVVGVITKKGVTKRKKNIASLSDSKVFIDYYINEFLMDIKTGKDIRIFKQRNILNFELQKHFEKYLKTIETTQNEQWKFSQKNSMIVVLLTSLSYIYIVEKAVFKMIGIGNILEFSGIISRLITAFVLLITSVIEFLSNFSFIKEFFLYIDMDTPLKSGINQLENKTEPSIEFCNVFFKYPNKTEFALKNINIKIENGKKIAIVGTNGSGKTTFVKLLCRLYDPTSGFINLNNNNIKDLDKEDYWHLFSIVFQDFKIFSFSVAENIAGSPFYHDEKIMNKLKKVGLEEIVNINTFINKDFDITGIELSGGESQKIAIARAFYKESPILIFDEPTASLDPVSESDIYKLINQQSYNKTVVFISHRLSSCKFCDEIIVFDNGCIVQQGSHDELLNDINGKYYSLWNAQAKHYQNK